jgi:hypothetical protein
MAAIPSRASIVNASFSVIVPPGPYPDLPPRPIGIAIDLISRGAEAVDTMPVDVALPGQELIDRKIVKLDYLLDRNPTAALFFTSIKRRRPATLVFLPLIAKSRRG